HFLRTGSLDVLNAYAPSTTDAAEHRFNIFYIVLFCASSLELCEERLYDLAACVLDALATFKASKDDFDSVALNAELDWLGRIASPIKDRLLKAGVEPPSEANPSARNIAFHSLKHLFCLALCKCEGDPLQAGRIVLRDLICLQKFSVSTGDQILAHEKMVMTSLCELADTPDNAKRLIHALLCELTEDSPQETEK